MLPAADSPRHISIRGGSQELAFLPSLGDCETLYSWCGAIQERSPYLSATKISTSLFGHSCAGFRHDIPSHIGPLTERTGKVLGSAEGLALRHTLLGYYLAFHTALRADSILTAAIDGSATHLKLRLGLLPRGLRTSHPLKYCPECVRADTASYERATWHLAHQLPGAFVCTGHARPLVQLTFNVPSFQLREWIRPASAHPSLAAQEHRLRRDQDISMALKLADVTWQAALLSPTQLSPHKLGQAYASWATRRGVLTPDGQLRSAELAEALRATGDLARFVGRLEPAFQQANPESALKWTLLSTDLIGPHPICHVLLIASLYESWSDFFSCVKSATDGVISTTSATSSS